MSEREKPNDSDARLPDEAKSEGWKAWEKQQDSIAEASEGVYSVKSRRQVNPDAPRGIVSEQIKHFEKIKSKEPERETVTALVSNPNSENIKSDPDLLSDFEKVRSEWREARNKAHKTEEEYQQKYQEHVLAQTKGIRGLVNLPRRMFGLQPRLNQELKTLQEASLVARIDYREAGLKLKEIKSTEGKTIGEVEKLASRYQRMLAHHLIVAVHKERLVKQKEGRGQAWQESKYLRPTIESLGRHKKTVGAVALGVGILTTGIVPVVAGVVAGFSTRIGLGKILDKTYVESARRNLIEGKKNIGKDFFEAELSDVDDEIEHLMFDVDTREARAKTITNTAAIAAGISAAGYVNGLEAENLNYFSEISPEIPNQISPETTNGGLIEREAVPDVETPIDEPKAPATEAEIKPESDEIPVSSSESTTESEITQSPKPETRDYSMPPATSVPDLPSQGIIETVPQAPAAEVAVPTETGPQIDNQYPVTTSEATATFGPVTGPSIEGLQSADLVTHTVEKGDNVWNILEGKGPDDNPVGGKSEVLEGMSLSDRHAALDKLVEYAEQNPEFAKEVGAVKSNGDIHRVYPGEEINVSMLDDKLRELLGIGEVASEATIPAEAAVSTEEVSEVEVQPEPVAEQVAEEPEVATYNEAAPEPHDINSMRVGDILSMQEAVENGDPQILEELNKMGFDKDSYNALNEAISSNIRQGESYDMTLPLTEWMNQYGQPAAPEPVPVSPQPESSPVLDRVSYTPSDTGMVGQEAITPAGGNTETTAAVKNYVMGIEKSSGFIFTKPDVSGTFESIRGLSIAEFKAMAANDNLLALLEERGVSFDGFKRWGEALQDQVKLIPANDTETVGDYVSRVANANQRTA